MKLPWANTALEFRLVTHFPDARRSLLLRLHGDGISAMLALKPSRIGSEPYALILVLP